MPQSQSELERVSQIHSWSCSPRLERIPWMKTGITFQGGVCCWSTSNLALILWNGLFYFFPSLWLWVRTSSGNYRGNAADIYSKLLLMKGECKEDPWPERVNQNIARGRWVWDTQKGKKMGRENWVSLVYMPHLFFAGTLFKKAFASYCGTTNDLLYIQ